MSDKLGVRIKWLGCACFEMDLGGVTVVSDPWITLNSNNDLTWESVEKCDFIVLSHGHYDHTLDIPALVDKFDPYVMCGENTAVPLLRWSNMCPMKIYPMSAGFELDSETLKIKALYGKHNLISAKADTRKEWAVNHKMNKGDPNLIELAFWGDIEYRNYLFTMPNGVKVLIWGSQLNSPGQRAMLREAKPDIAILQTTPGNPGADLAAICKEIGCKAVISHHIDFPNDYSQVAWDLKNELAKSAPEIQCIIPEYGKWIEL